MNEIDGIINEIKQNIRGSYKAIYHGSRLSLKLYKSLHVLSGQGKVSGKSVAEYESFLDRNQGKTRNVSIPVRKDRADLVKQLFDKELELEKASKRKDINRIQNEIRQIRAEIPELQELDRRGIDYYLIPKIDGEVERIQLAIAEKDLAKFNEWFAEHLQTNLSSPDLTMDEFQVFTDQQYEFYKIPFEGDRYKQLIEEMKSFRIGAFALQDLKEGDFESWIAIPDTDARRALSYLKAKGISYQNGSKNEYLATAQRSDEETIVELLSGETETEFYMEPEIEDAYAAALESDTSYNYAMNMTNENCQVITVSKEYAVTGLPFDTMQEEYGPKGYFALRMPETYGDDSQIILFDRNRVFQTSDNQEYKIFVYKNEGIRVIDPSKDKEKDAMRIVAAPKIVDCYQEAFEAQQRVEELVQAEIEKASEKIAESVQEITKDIAKDITL